MASLLAGFPTVAATYVRPSGSYVNGEWTEEISAPVEIDLVSPQPADGRSLQLLPEGDRVYEHMMTWTVEALQPRDIVTLDAVEYRVILARGYDQAVRGWDMDGFTKVLMREVQS